MSNLQLLLKTSLGKVARCLSYRPVNEFQRLLAECVCYADIELTMRPNRTKIGDAMLEIMMHLRCRVVTKNLKYTPGFSYHSKEFN